MKNEITFMSLSFIEIFIVTFQYTCRYLYICIALESNTLPVVSENKIGAVKLEE